MSIGNLICGVNSVTVSYLIRYNSLLQTATQNATAILLQNATEVYYKSCQVFFFITKCDSYYKLRQLYYKIQQLL